MFNYNLLKVNYELSIGTKSGDLEWRYGRYVALFKKIILDHDRAVVIAIVVLLVSNLHTAVTCILSISLILVIFFILLLYM